MHTILLTGATGYIGSNIVRRLVNNGVDVHVIIRESSKLDLIGDIKDKINIHIFNGDTMGLVKLFHSVQPDVVIHLAALFISEHKPENIVPLIESNIQLGAQLLEAAATAGVKYFINTGTHWQNYNEEAYNPVNLYAATKRAFECMARYYTETTEMRMLTVKLIDTYGPFDPRPKVMSLFKRIAESGEKLDMSPGNQELGLLYIDDVVKGFMLALRHIQKMQPHEQTDCILAPDRFYKLKEIAGIFQEVSGVSLNINWGKRPYRKREIMNISLSNFNILEGHKLICLKEGIRRMLGEEGKV